MVTELDEAKAVAIEAAPALPSDADDKHDARQAGRGVWALNIAELFSGWGWGMVASLRFYFLVVTLQLPLPAAGLIEGVALGFPHVARALLGRRTIETNTGAVATLGYVLQNTARPLLAIVGSWIGAFSVVLTESVGRGGTSAVKRHTGPMYPDYARWGGAAGAIAVGLILIGFTPGLTDAFLYSAVPGAIAAGAAILWSTRRLATVRADVETVERVAAQASARYDPRFWLFTGVSAVFALGNVSVSFFLLRLASFEQPVHMLAFAFALYVAVAALLANPARLLRARWGSLPTLLTGFSVLVAVTFGWVLVGEAWQGWVLLALAGGATALISGVGRSAVAAYAVGGGDDRARRIYDGVTGLAMLPGNALAGLFWVTGGPGLAFGYAGWVMALALALMLAWMPWLRRGFA